MVPFIRRLEGNRASFGTWSLRRAWRRFVLSLGVIGLAVVLGAGASRADEVDIAFQAFTPALAAAGVNLGETGTALAKSLVRCALSGKTVLNCARDELIRTLPEKAQPFAQCLLGPGGSPETCAQQAVIAQLPPEAQGLADCIARRADVVSCSKEFALNEGQKKAFEAIDQLKADARSELRAPSSGLIRNIICIAKGVQEEDWPSVIACGGVEAAKIAGKALVRVLLPGPLLALAPLLDPVVDATIQNRADLLDRLIAAARAGDEAGLVQVVAEAAVYLNTPVVQWCALIPTFEAKDRVCDALTAAIGEFGGRIGGGVDRALDGDPVGGAADIAGAPLGAGCQAADELFGFNPCEEAKNVPLVGDVLDLFNINCERDENYYPRNMAACRAHAAFFKLQDPARYNELEGTVNWHCRNYHRPRCDGAGKTSPRLDDICNPLRDKFKREVDKLADDLKGAAARYASTYPPFTLNLEPGEDCDARASQRFIIDCLKALPSPGDGANCRPGGKGLGVNPASLMNVCSEAAFVGEGANLRLNVRATCRWRIPDRPPPTVLDPYRPAPTLPTVPINRPPPTVFDPHRPAPVPALPPSYTPQPPPTVIACPRGMAGTPGNCYWPVPPPCPQGMLGTPPNCYHQPTPRPCPQGMLGTPPNCYHQPTPRPCPQGMLGTPPNCYRPAPRPCPPGMLGTPPNCYRPAPPRCAQGMLGTPPNCYRPAPTPKPPQQCPLVRTCVQHGKGRPGSFGGPCIRYQMRRQCPSGGSRLN